MFKIAFIKEACYQDLWIGDNNDTSSDLIRSTLLRTGPIGLLEIFGGDFFIVKSNNSKAAQKIRFSKIPKDYLSKEDYKSSMTYVSHEAEPYIKTKNFKHW